jgi:hypothetical protein
MHCLATTMKRECKMVAAKWLSCHHFLITILQVLLQLRRSSMTTKTGYRG